jgi:hypothetical protein
VVASSEPLSQVIVSVATLVTAAGGLVAALRSSGHAKRGAIQAYANRDMFAQHLTRVEGAYAQMAQVNAELIRVLSERK